MTSPEHKEHKQKSRYPFIQIVGVPGSGKSTLASLLEVDTGAYLLHEPFVENPHLEDFYTKNPADHAFDVQISFLANDGLLRKKVPGFLANNTVLIDAGKEVNSIIEKVQWDMGFITDDDHKIYKSLEKNTYEKKHLLKPDISIAMKAKTENVVNMIYKRGREMELLMLQRFPGYFPAIVEEFNVWLTQAKYVIVVESDKYDIVSDQSAREKVMRDIKNRAGYFIHAPTQLNLRGSDGSDLIFPDFLRPQHHIRDIVPNTPAESTKFRR